MRVNLNPTNRLEKIDSKLATEKKQELGPCGGFSYAYKCMCDYYGVTYLDDVQWVCCHPITSLLLTNNE